ncbi:MAG: glycoside hydrolase [Caldithrix sp.]|nr:glycoside hydrolase [Caldithrix sp.]
MNLLLQFAIANGSCMHLINSTRHRRLVFSVWIIGVLLLYQCQPAARFHHLRNPDETEKRHTLHELARSWQGTPYSYGGSSRNGIDCSALVQSVYQSAFGIKLPRTARAQMQKGRMVRMPWLRTGDLLFFENTFRSGVDHVGIYLGNNKFLHATSSRGVMIDALNDYYRNHLYRIVRYLSPSR